MRSKLSTAFHRAWSLAWRDALGAAACGARSGGSQKEVASMSDHILVVDDDKSIRHLVTLILQTENYRVETAADGQEALDSIADDIPSALFLDMNMPVLDGWAVARTLHDQGQQVPIVVHDGCARCLEVLPRGGGLRLPAQAV